MYVFYCNVLKAPPPSKKGGAQVGGQFARAIKFCRMANNTLRIITAVFFLHTTMCIRSHARSRKRQKTVRFKDHCRIVGPQHASFLPSCAYNLEVAPRLLKDVLTPTKERARCAIHCDQHGT